MNPNLNHKYWMEHCDVASKAATCRVKIACVIVRHNMLLGIANNVRPQDYVVSSGETHSIYDFMNECYKLMITELDKPCSFALEDLFEVDTMLFRPNEVSYLKGDSSAIQKDWGWKPVYNFHSLVKDMLLSDYNNVLKSENSHEVKIKV